MFGRTDGKLTRKSGLTLTELLISLTIVVVILGIISTVTSMTFKNAARVRESMTLDEAVVRLQTSLRQIVTRNWTASQTTGETDDPDGSVTFTSQSLVFYTAVPNISGDWQTVVSTLTYQDSALLFQFPNYAGDGVSTSRIVEDLIDFSFNMEGSLMIYNATFSTGNMTRNATGVVRFY